MPTMILTRMKTVFLLLLLSANQATAARMTLLSNLFARTTTTTASFTCQVGKTLALSTYKEATDLRLVKTGTSPSHVCVLWRITLAGSRVPVARSYDGNNWEAQSGPYSRQKFTCTSTVCTTRLPTQTDTQRYELTSYQRRTLTKDESAARFLEQTTFGPRVDEIRSFTNATTLTFTQWILNQSSLPITSHRAEFRKRLNHRFPTGAKTKVGRVTHPCEVGTRYRRAAFTDKDQSALVEIKTLSTTQKALFIGANLRTVVNASQLYLNAVQQGQQLADGKYRVCDKVETWIGGQFRLLQNGVCGNLFADNNAVGNPAVNLDSSSALTATIVDLSNKVQMVDTQYYKVAQDLLVTFPLSQCTQVTQDSHVFGVFDGKYWLHDPRFVIDENTLENPNTEVCSSAPPTFLNEASCVLKQTTPCSTETSDVTSSVDLVCGSPFEVANNASLAGSLLGGAFDIVTSENKTTPESKLMEQNLMIWMDVALSSKDQLRQRTAWALSQILVVAPYALESWYSNEVFLTYYDIFVRNAFGNYRDILKEVSYSPVMGQMLSYLGSQSTAIIWQYSNRYEFADENFAREIMQLFSVGLYQLNQDGTLLLDRNNLPILTYTNDDIMEYARMWTGFKQQPRRNNVEDFPSPWISNLIDPMMIRVEARDSLPKMGLNRAYVGDGYPLCADLPSQHFLKRGATYRLLGPKPKPRLLNDPESWTNSTTTKRFSLGTSSNLYQALCKSSGGACSYPAKVVLQTNIACTGIECEIDEPRIVQVSGMYYEYTRLPCVEQAFFSNPAMMTNQWGWAYCADRRTAAGSVACCPDSTGRANTSLVKFDGEKMTFDRSAARCKANGMAVCDVPWWQCNGCNTNLGHWTTHSCNLVVKVNRDGKIGIVHEVQDSRPNVGKSIYYNVANDTKTSFRVDWQGPLDTLLSSYNTQCVTMGCKFDSMQNVCLCPVSVVTDSPVFSTTPTVTQVLLQLPIGSFAPDILPGSYSVRDLGGGVLMHSTDGLFSAKSIFQVTDANGVTHLRKNVKSTVTVGSGGLSFRNPSHFTSLAFPELRDAVYETDAGLDHYFYHPNTAPFLASRMLQRFGESNPSPRMISTAANAFRTGVYVAGGVSLGSRKYGDMFAMMAAILLDRESRAPILDADPVSGSLQEPFLRYVRAMRSLEFKTSADAPYIRFKTYFPNALGQQPHLQTSVFSFFKPEYSPSGPVGNAGLYCPECQLTDGPKAITLMNALNSLLKYGLSSDYGGFGYGRGLTPSKGNYTNSYGNLALKLSDSLTPTQVVDELALLLTAGRLDAQKRTLMVNAFNSQVSRTQGIITVEQMMLTTPEFHTNSLSQNNGGAVTPPPLPAANTKPYKAVVYVMLSGGVDSFNLLVPQVCTGTNSAGITVDQQYNVERGSLAIPSGERSLQIAATGQPCSSFAIHKELPLFKSLYDAGDLSFIANMGVLNEVSGIDKVNYMAKTRVQLFAHNWMQQEAKTMDPKAAKFGTGILGRMSSVLKDKGYTPGSVSFDSESVTVSPERTKSPKPVVVSPYGVSKFDAKPYADSFDLTSYAKQLNAKPNSTDSLLGQTWSARFLDGMNEAEFFKSKIEQAPLGDHWSWDIGHIGYQFRMLSKLVKSRDVRGVDRDVFYTEFGGWDHHNGQVSGLQNNFRELNKSLEMLVTELKLQGVWNDVTIVIASEFGRTLTPNSGGGADHAWGGNYAMMGGDVKGGKVLGQYPSDLTEKGPLNVGRGRFIPTTSWDAVWNGVAQWMGVTAETELDYCLPNRKATSGVSGFTSLFSRGDLFQSVARKRHLRERRVDPEQGENTV